MRLSTVASATLSLLLVFGPAVRAQDEGMKPPKAEKDTKKDDKKPGDEKKPEKKGEKGDEGDDDDEDEKPVKEERLPINPFAKSKKGDWSVCVGKMKVAFQGQNIDQNVKLVMRVKETSDAEVVVEATESGGMGAAAGNQTHKATFSLKENPTFTKYMNMRDNAPKAQEKFEDWKAEDDKKTVGGKEFTCKKITAKIKDKMGMDAKLSMWLTDDTKGWGVIAMTLKGTIMGNGGFSMDVELKGYGNGDTADFGKKPEEEKTGEDEGDGAPKKDAKKAPQGDDDMPKAPKKDKKDKKDDDD